MQQPVPMAVLLLLLSTAAAGVAALAAAPTPDADTATLKACLAAKQLKASAQNSDAYAKLQTFNAQARGAKLMPVAFVEPTTTEEVAAAVKCAAAAGLPFAARNGGHSYEAASLLDQGVVIDLRALASLSVDAGNSVLTVGGGQKLGPIYLALASDGFVLPAGTCVGVGISGTTLGGGIGHSTRSLGVLADSVLAATVVLANGTVVEASSSSNPDLFWAIRGGGPLYGIVTLWKFKIHKAPPKVTVVKYKFQEGCTGPKYAEVLAAFNAWKPWELPKEFAMAEVQCGYGSLGVQFWLWGNMTQAEKAMKASPVFKLPGITAAVQKELDWTSFVVDVMSNLHDDKNWNIQDLTLNNILQAQDRGSFVAGSFLPATAMDSKQVATMAKYMAAVQQHAFIQCRAWGAQVAAVPNDFNAFPWRSALFECQLYSNSGTAKDRVWLDSLLDEMHSLTGQTAAFYNYFHCVKDPWSTYFGPHAERLKQIKQAYDPLGRLGGGLNCQPGMQK